MLGCGGVADLWILSSFEAERSEFRVDLNYCPIANLAAENSQDFSGLWIRYQADGADDFQPVANFQSGLAAHVDGEQVIVYICHQGRNFQPSRRQKRGPGIKLCANGVDSFGYGFTHQRLVKIGKIDIKSNV